jgi:hypothetical protein
LISAVHRTVQLDLPVVLVGAGLPQLPGLTGSAKSYAERLFRFPQIGTLAPAEARDVLELPVLDAGVTYQAGARPDPRAHPGLPVLPPGAGLRGLERRDPVADRP